MTVTPDPAKPNNIAAKYFTHLYTFLSCSCVYSILQATFTLSFKQNDDDWSYHCHGVRNKK